MFVTGPKVIQDVTGKICSMNELGGSSIHAEYSGVAHFISETEKECFNEVRKLIKMIPSSNILNKNENFKFSQKYFSQIGTFVPKELELSRKV